MHGKGKGFPVVLRFCFSLPAQPWILYKDTCHQRDMYSPRGSCCSSPAEKAGHPQRSPPSSAAIHQSGIKELGEKNEDVTHVIIFHSWSVISISMCSGDAVPSAVEDSSRLACRSCLLGGRTSQEPFTFRWSQKFPGGGHLMQRWQVCCGHIQRASPL